MSRINEHIQPQAKNVEDEFETAIDDLCKLLDSDHNGAIDVEEFSAIYPHAGRYFFSKLDMNKDGMLSREEVRQHFLSDGKQNLERVKALIFSLQRELKLQARENLVAHRALEPLTENNVAEALATKDELIASLRADSRVDKTIAPTQDVNLAHEIQVRDDRIKVLEAMLTGEGDVVIPPINEELAEKTQKIFSLEQALATVESEKDTQIASLEIELLQLESMRARSDMLEHQVQALEFQLQSANESAGVPLSAGAVADSELLKQIQQLKQQLADVPIKEARILELENDLLVKDSELTMLVAQLKDAHAKVEDTTAMRPEIEGLQLQLTQIPEKDSKILELQSEITLLKSKIEILDGRLTESLEMQDELRSFRERAMSLELQVEERERDLERCERVREEKIKLEKFVELLQNELISKKHEVRKMELNADTASVVSSEGGDMKGRSGYKQVQALLAQLEKQEDDFYRELTSEREKYGKEKQELTETIEKLSSQLEAKISGLRALETEMHLKSREFSETISSLKDQNALLHATAHNKDVLIDERNSMIERLKEEKSSQRKKFSEVEIKLKETISEFQTDVGRKEAELAGLQDIRRNLEARLDEQNIHSKELLTRIHSMSQASNDLSVEVSSKSNKLSQMQLLLNERQAAIADLINEKSQLEKDIGSLESQNESYADNLTEKIESIKMLEEALDRRVTENSFEKRELMSKIDNMRATITEKTEQIFTLQTKMDLSFQDFEKRIERLEKERAELRADNNRLQVERNEVERMMHNKVEEYDDSKLKRELRMLEVKLSESHMEKHQLETHLKEVETRFETRVGVVNKELEQLRSGVTQLNREKGSLLAKLKSGTMEDATMAQVEYEKTVRDMQMNIDKLKLDFERQVNDMTEQVELEKTRAEVGKRKLKEAMDMKIAQLETQIGNMSQHHREEVSLLKEAHAKQMQAARSLPNNAAKANLAEVLPQTDLDLIKELQEQLRNMQLKAQMIDDNWSGKFERLKEESEDRVRLLKSRQTGLSDVERGELEEQVRFLQNKAEVHFRAKGALENQIQNLEEKLQKVSSESTKLVAEISTLQKEIIKQSKSHKDQLELLRQSPGKEVNERLLNLVTDGMNFQHDKEERLVKLTQQLQDRERDLRDQLDEQKEFYVNEMAEMKAMNSREIEMTIKKYSSTVSALKQELSRISTDLDREREFHERTILENKTAIHQERVNLDKSANIEQERLRAVYLKEKLELETVIQNLGDDLLREKQKNEDQKVEFQKMLALKKAELDEMHIQEVSTLQRVKSMQEDKYGNHMKNMEVEHERALEHLSKKAMNREQQHAEEIKSHQQKFRERVADLQSEIANKESRIRNLENTVEDQKASYEGANAELREKITSLNGEIAELETYVIKCRDLEEQLVEFKQAAEYLEQQVSQLQQQLDEQMNDSNIVLSKTKLEGRAKQDHLEDTLKQTKAELELKTTEYDDLYEKHHETQQQYVKVLKDYQVEKERYSSDMDDLKQVQKDVVDKLHQDRAQLQWQLQELKHQLENADNLKQQALRDLQKRHDTIKQQLDWDVRDLKYQLTQAQKVTELEVDRAQTKGSKIVQQRDFEIQTLKGQINQLNEQMQIEVAKERNRMKIKLDTSSAHIEQLNRERETVVVDFQNRIGELRKENDELRQFQAHHAADSYRAEDLKYQVKQLQGKQDQNMLEIQVWQAECMNKQERISGLEKERDTLKRELTVFKQEVFSNQPMNMNSAKDLTKMQEEISRKDVKISHMKKEIQDLQMEVNLAKYQLESRSHPDVPIQKRMEMETIMDLEKQMGGMKKKAKKREQELVGKYRESQETVKRLDGALRNALHKHGELNRTVLKLRQEVGYLQRRTERAESIISGTDGTHE